MLLLLLLLLLYLVLNPLLLGGKLILKLLHGIALLLLRGGTEAQPGHVAETIVHDRCARQAASRANSVGSLALTGSVRLCGAYLSV